MPLCCAMEHEINMPRNTFLLQVKQVNPIIGCTPGSVPADQFLEMILQSKKLWEHTPWGPCIYMHSAEIL